jgi:hypothetical protein
LSNEQIEIVDELQPFPEIDGGDDTQDDNDQGLNDIQGINQAVGIENQNDDEAQGH